MNKKRVVLHTCILLLAITCMLAGMYVCYNYIRENRYDDIDVYNCEYSFDVMSILEYGNANLEYRKKFSDKNKILIENKELGNVTVADIKKIYADKYSEFYTDDRAIGFSDYNEYFEYLYGDGGIQENQREKTLYDIDVILRKKYKKQWEKNSTEENREIYLYYKNKCAYVNEYAKLVEILMNGIVSDNGQTERFNETSFLLNSTYPVIGSGMLYQVTYNIRGEKIEFTNVEEASMFDNPNEYNLRDLTVLRVGQLVQEAPAFGNKHIHGYLTSDNEMKFLKSASEIYVGINGNDATTHYASMMEKAKIQLKSEKALKSARRNVVICIILICVTIVLAFILYIVLMAMAGHKRKGDMPQLNKSDRVWWDVELAVGIFVFFIIYNILLMMESNGYYKWFAIAMVVVSVPAVEVIVLFSESIMRRLKTGSFIQTTLAGKICSWTKRLAKKSKVHAKKIACNMRLSWKIVVLGAALFVGQVMTSLLTLKNMEVIAWMSGIIFIVCGCYIVWKYFSENQIIVNGATQISEGNINYKIDETMKFGINESLKQSINGIGDGLNEAVAANLKNERMKTELITNVSHDLKTPLTSIINYVDLLKTEGVNGKNTNKYLDVLEQKSQRLKQLTEDLVEASKLNSGVVVFQREKLDIVQLVNQSIAEYDDKLRMKKIQIVKTIQDAPMWVMADGRKTWRLLDNLYNNVYKYAMEGTRVYIDIRREERRVFISIKNISKRPLNFSADEIMERFVRGDESRTTEGSGLGLSIARSIVERQDGEMKIVLDGDLFKVEIMMNLI